MLKTIYADERLDEIYATIQTLDTVQYYFIMRHLEQEKQQRQQIIFQQWLNYLHTITKN